MFILNSKQTKDVSGGYRMDIPVLASGVNLPRSALATPPSKPAAKSGFSFVRGLFNKR